MPINRRNKTRPRGGRRTNIARRLVPTQGDRAAFAGQQIAIMDVPGDVRLAITTAGNSIAQVFAINAANIQTNFHGYFNSVFQEYRIRRVVFHITAVSPAAPGCSFFRFEEKNSGSPTLNEMANSASVFKPNNGNNSASTLTMTWTAPKKDIADLEEHLPGLELIFVESGGDNLAANYSRELADYIIYVIDVSGGDKIPRKGGPGISQSDLLVINKTDIAQYVNASLDIMDRDSKLMRGDGPTIFCSVKEGKGVEDVANLILAAWRTAGNPGKPGAVGDLE